jgi:aspartate dehydrogenase
MVRVGLVGCGTIGTALALAIQHRYAHVARIVGLHDASPSHAATLQRRLADHPPIVSLATLIRGSQTVLEAASAAAAPGVVRAALRAHRDVLVMSVGGLLGDRTWMTAARRSRGRVYIASGALAALDGVKALAVGRICRARLTTSKPPRALASAPYVVRRGLRLERLRRPKVLLSGTPRQVVAAFPQNTNVAAALTLALAGHPAARIRVRVVADPRLRRNRHELEVEGDCGRIACQVESRPSRNPRTSELAVRSAVATLARLLEPVHIGT